MQNLLQDSNLIEKSKALVWSRFARYDAGELQLLEAYLGRINPREPTKSEVRFTLSEYSKYMGVPGLRASQVKAYTKHLLENVVEIPLDRPNGYPHQYVQMTLFCWATCEFDSSIGQYVITIDCNPKLKEVFFDFAKGGYIQYRSRDTKSMRSKYSILLYCLLRDLPSDWEFTLPKLRDQLGADDSSYDAWKDFRRWVLDPAVNEINKTSTMTVSYTTVTYARKIVSVKFHHEATAAPKIIAAPAEASGFIAQPLPKKPPRVGSGAWYALACAGELDAGQAFQLAKSIKQQLTATYRIPADKLNQAAYDTLQLAYQRLIRDRSADAGAVDNVGAYLWAVLGKAGGAAEYLPGHYLVPGLKPYKG